VSTMAGPYLAAARIAADKLDDPAVARRWDQPSALARMSVAELAGHLARQVFNAQDLVDQGPCDRQPISLAEHYARSAWTDAALDDEPNVQIRRGGAAEAAQGPAALAARTRAAIDWLAARLPGEAPDRAVLLPWGPWPLTLDDFLTTRLMEIAVHVDDLAHSVGLPTPALPSGAADAVLVLLTRLAATRHGTVAVIRALSRAERAPATIAAF
jgi:hypothetical protein